MTSLKAQKIRWAKLIHLICCLCSFTPFTPLATLTYAQTPQTNLYHRALAATCANCHGTDGKGVADGGMPLINNIPREKMLAQLKAYKSGTLEGTIMPQLMKGYSDEQIEIITSQLGKQ
jgi:cytochrome c553